MEWDVSTHGEPHVIPFDTGMEIAMLCDGETRRKDYRTPTTVLKSVAQASELLDAYGCLVMAPPNFRLNDANVLSIHRCVDSMEVDPLDVTAAPYDEAKPTNYTDAQLDFVFEYNLTYLEEVYGAYCLENFQIRSTIIETEEALRIMPVVRDVVAGGAEAVAKALFLDLFTPVYHESIASTNGELAIDYPTCVQSIIDSISRSFTFNDKYVKLGHRSTRSWDVYKGIKDKLPST